MPVALTLKLADVPAHVVTDAGCVTIAVATLFVTAATALVILVQALLTTA